MLNDSRRDIDKMSEELTNLSYDYKTYKDQSTVDTLDNASLIQMEVMQSKLESKDTHTKLSQLIYDFSQSESVMKEKFEKFLKDSPDLGKDALAKEKERQKKEIDEIFDGKIRSAFESLRKDNQYIWHQSIALAEKEFN